MMPAGMALIITSPRPSSKPVPWQTPFSGPLKILLFNVIHTEPPAPSNVKPGVPRDLEVICLKALAKRPEHRFVGCQEMADDLRRWLEGEPILARRPGRIERLARW